MQFTPWDNPMGTDGFEFVEYTAPDPEQLRRLFERMGFPAVARHRSKNVTLHRQGDINFIINAEASGFGQQFARAQSRRFPRVALVLGQELDAAGGGEADDGQEIFDLGFSIFDWQTGAGR